MRIMLFIFLTALLGSCGKSGALYLPSDEGVTKEKIQNNETINKP